MLPITHLTVHCAATPQGRDVKAASINEWDKAKFGQTSYHWIVELDGTKVRGLEDNELGAHVGGHNTGNIGVCYVGGMDVNNQHPKDTRTAAQRQTLRLLVGEYETKYEGLIVLGHRDWPNVKKDCPCFDVKTEL